MALISLHFRLSEPALRDLEAALVSYGFHPVGIEMIGREGGCIKVHDDRLFCLCCGKRIDGITFRTFDHKCLCFDCKDHLCERTVPPDEFFRNHAIIDTILRAIAT